MSLQTHEDVEMAADGSTPSVSVIIPAFNAAATLPACLTSVGEARYDGNVETIVVDDGSTDATGDIARRFGCHVVRRDGNLGPASARNAGAGAAHGDILLFVDADTEMRPDTIRCAVAALQQDGVAAVTGMYEPEPINNGFFPRYYAYLKFHAFTSSDATDITAFGAQCGAVYKRTFDAVGGYASIRWGVDIENEEFGYRLNQVGRVALGRSFRVRHNFPSLRKLLYVFTNRVYWWTQFRRLSKRDETVLMTRGFGMSTAAGAASLMSLAVIPALSGAWSPFGFAALAVTLGAFVHGYAGFWRECLRRRGWRFAAAAAAASWGFSVVITAAAVCGFAVSVWPAMRGRTGFASLPHGRGSDHPIGALRSA